MKNFQFKRLIASACAAALIGTSLPVGNVPMVTAGDVEESEEDISNSAEEGTFDAVNESDGSDSSNDISDGDSSTMSNGNGASNVGEDSANTSSDQSDISNESIADDTRSKDDAGINSRSESDQYDEVKGDEIEQDDADHKDENLKADKKSEGDELEQKSDEEDAEENELDDDAFEPKEDHIVEVTAVAEADSGEKLGDVDIEWKDDIAILRAPNYDNYTYINKITYNDELVRAVENRSVDEVVTIKDEEQTFTHRETQYSAGGDNWISFEDDSAQLVFHYKKEEVAPAEKKTVQLEAAFVDEDGETIRDGYQLRGDKDLTKAPVAIDGYDEYIGAKLGGETVTSLKQEEKHIEKDNVDLTYYKAEGENGTITIEDDATVTFVYRKNAENENVVIDPKVTFTAKYVDLESYSRIADSRTVKLTGEQDSQSLDDYVLTDTAITDDYKLENIKIGGKTVSEVGKETTKESKDHKNTTTTSYYYVDANGEKHEVTEDTTVTFGYSCTIKNIAVTARAVDEKNHVIAGQYSFALKEGSNKLSEVAPKIKGYEFKQATVDGKKVSEVTKETNGKRVTYQGDGVTWTSNTRIYFVYKEDITYTTRLTATASDGSAEVTASMKESAKIPEGTKLVVDALTGSRRRVALDNASREMGVNRRNVYGVVYDIYLQQKDGTRIQPDDTIHITMSFNGGVDLGIPDNATKKNTAVVHLHGNESGVVGSRVRANNGVLTFANFNAESFSAYCVVYTVEFTYNGFQYVLKGGESVQLSEVLKVVGIDRSVSDVEKVTFTNEKLVKINKNTEDADWTLKSLEPFASNEKLTIRMDGGDEYVVEVTDENPVGATNLNKLPDNGYVSFTYAMYPQGKEVDGKTVYERNTKIDFKMSYTIPAGYKDNTSPYQAYYTIPVTYLTLISPTQSGLIFKPNSSEKVGTYTVDPSTGLVIFTYDDDKYHENYQGTFEFSAKIDNEKIPDNNIVPIELSQNDIVTITVEPGKITGNKIRKNLFVENGKLKQSYEISLDVTKRLENFELTDVISTNQSFDKESFKIIKGEQEFSFGKVIDNDNGTAKLSMSSIDPGNYKVSYTTTVDTTTSSNITNEASWSWTGGSNSSNKIDFNIEANPSVKKELTNKNKKLFADEAAEWKVTINKGEYATRETMGQATYRDDIPNDMQLDKKSLKIVDTQNNKTLIEGTDYILSGEDPFTINFTYTAEYNVPIYQITYRTTFKEGHQPTTEETITNKGEFKPNGDSKSYEGQDSGTVGKRHIKKTADKNNIKEINNETGKYSIAKWNVNANVDAGSKKVSISDGLWTGLMTNIIDNSIRVSINSAYVSPDKYQISFPNEQNDNFKGTPYESSSHNRFTVTFDDDTLFTSDTSVTMEYQTVTNLAKLTPNANIEITNSASLTWNENKSETTNDQIVVVNKVRLGSIKKETGGTRATNYIWYISANFGKDQWGNPMVASDYTGKEMYVTDTLPEHMTYVKGSAKYYLTDAYNDPTYPSHQGWVEIEPSVSQDGKTLTFNFGTTDETHNIGNHKVKIYLETKVDEEYLKDKGDCDFVNEASYGDKDGEINHTSETLTVPGKGMTKTGKLIEDESDPNYNCVEYVVKINPPEKGFEVDSQYLDADDELPKNGLYKMGSAEVKDITAGSNLTSSVTQIRYANGHLLFRIPDNGHQYEIHYIVSPKLPEYYNKGNKVAVPLVNKISLKGQKTISASSDESFNIQTSSATGDSVSGTLILVKYNQKDNKKITNDNQISYELHKLEYDAINKQFHDKKVDTATGTDSEGALHFKKDIIEKDVLYYYKETKAPIGYEIDNTKHYVYVAGYSANLMKPILDSVYPGWNLNVTEDGEQIVTDVPQEDGNVGSLTLKKVLGTVKPAGSDDHAYKFTVQNTSTKKYYGNGTSGNDPIEIVVNPKISEGVTLTGLPYGTYAIEEVATSAAFTGYTVDVTGDKSVTVGAQAATATLTNTYSEETGSLTLKKKLGTVKPAGSDDHAYKFTVQNTSTKKYYGNGTSGNAPIEIVVNPKISEGVTLTGLPYGTYAIEEVATSAAFTGYTVDVTGDKSVTVGAQAVSATIKNTYTEITTTVSGTKTWSDGNNQDGIRPKSITVNLLADGTKVDSKTVTENGKGEWLYEFTNLPKYKDGKEIVYTITEDAVANYETKVNGFNITNTHTPGTVDLSGTKTWSDGNNQDGIRPASITVRLHADGKEIDSKTVTAADGWKYSFTNLPEYNNGTKIVYTITEDATSGYSTEVKGMDITNTYTPGKRSITVTKAWEDNGNADGIRPASVQVLLLADGAQVGDIINLSADNNWTYTWSDLPVKKGGKDINYNVGENNVPQGYVASFSGSADRGFTITNTHETTKRNVSVTKRWADDNNAAGVRPASIQVQLYADGVASGEAVTLDAGNNWMHVWSGLDSRKDGKDISYTVTENGVPAGYVSATTGDVENGFVITNTLELAKGSVILTKTDDETGAVLAGARFALFGPKGQIGEYTTDGAGRIKVDNLDAGEYYFTETAAPEGYELSEAHVSFRIVASATVTAPVAVSATNHRTAPKMLTVSARKIWDDSDNVDGVRPASVTIRLYANGREIASQTASEANGWSVSFGELPKQENGVDINYAVSEDEVGYYYEAFIDGQVADGAATFTVRNYRETDKQYEDRTGSVRGAWRGRPQGGSDDGGAVQNAGRRRGFGTGDNGNMTVYAGAGIAALAGLGAWFAVGKKRKKEDEE